MITFFSFTCRMEDEELFISCLGGLKKTEREASLFLGGEGFRYLFCTRQEFFSKSLNS